MNKKHMVIGLFLFAAFVLSIPGAAIASDTQYDFYNLTIQPGTDETELNFCWFTTDPDDCQLVVCNAGALKDGEFPKSADVYAGYVEVVIVAEPSGGGFPPPPGGEDSDGDGVGDDRDQCPDTPEGVTVNEDGCPDEDGDGVADSDDLCPNTPSCTGVNETGCPVFACKVTMTNVKNNKKYAYAVGNGENFSEIYYFDTENSNNYNFIFISDPQIGASRNVESDTAGWAETVTAALTKFKNASFILSAGDQVEHSTSNSEYNGFFFAEELTSVPYAPTMGNHDQSTLYAHHFNVSNESSLGQLEVQSESETISFGGDYWFTYGNTLFMVLNTNNKSALSHSVFMEEAIDANPGAKWRVVVFHHALYSSARHVDDVNDLRTSMYPEIDKYDIDVVLTGHDHFYARTYQLSGGDVVESVDCQTTLRCPPPGVPGDCEWVTTCVDTIGDVVAEEDQQIIGQGKVLNPIGTTYIIANSASGSKYYDYTYRDGYTNIYLAKYEQAETPCYLNVEVNSSALTITAYYVNDETGESEMFDTYSILKTD